MRYLKEGAPHIGAEYVAATLEQAEMLVRHPDAGRIVLEFATKHIRELTHSPFRVVYLRQETEVVLIRVWRSERQLVLAES